MRSGPQKDPTMITNLRFSAALPILLRREKGWNWSEGSMMPLWWSLCKNPNSMGFRELVGWQTYAGAGTVTCLKREWKLCAPGHRPCPVHLFHLTVHLYSLSYFKIKGRKKKKQKEVTVFLNSVSHSGGLIRSEEGDPHGNLWFVADWSEAQSGLLIVIGSGKNGPESLICGIWGYFRVDSVRIKSQNSQPGSQKIAWCGEALPTFDDLKCYECDASVRVEETHRRKTQ